MIITIDYLAKSCTLMQEQEHVIPGLLTRLHLKLQLQIQIHMAMQLKQPLMENCFMACYSAAHQALSRISVITPTSKCRKLFFVQANL